MSANPLVVAAPPAIPRRRRKTRRWAGWAFVAIGLGITALTLIGYFFAGDWFNLWMAVVDGGGLILGGLWMRRS